MSQQKKTDKSKPRVRERQSKVEKTNDPVVKDVKEFRRDAGVYDIHAPAVRSVKCITEYSAAFGQEHNVAGLCLFVSMGPTSRLDHSTRHIWPENELEEEYLFTCQAMLDAVHEENPKYQDQIRELLSKYVEYVLDKQPDSVLQMLVELPINDLKSIMQDWSLLSEKVEQADDQLHPKTDDEKQERDKARLKKKQPITQHPFEHQQEDYSQALSAAIASSEQDPIRGMRGHTVAQVQRLGKLLNLNTMHHTEFEERRKQKLELKKQSVSRDDDRPAFPALCMYDDHVSLLWPAGLPMKRFTYKQLRQAFEALLDNRDTKFKFAYAHAATRAEKKVRTLTKEIGVLNQRIREAPKFSKQFASMMYKYRQMRKEVQEIDFDGLPASHQSDFQYMLFTQYLRDDIDHPLRNREVIPLPVSKFQLELYFAMNKKKSPFHMPQGKKEVVVYVKKPEAVLCGANASTITFREKSPTCSFQNSTLISILTDRAESSEKLVETARHNRVQVRLGETGCPERVICTTQSQGQIPKSAHLAFNMFLTPIEKNAVMTVGDRKGCHNVMATMRNVFQNRIFNEVITKHLLAMVKGQEYVTVHLGSKFVQVQGIMQEALFTFFKSLARKMGLEVAERRQGEQVQAPAVTIFSDWWAQTNNRSVEDVRQWFQAQNVQPAGWDVFDNVWTAPGLIHVRPDQEQYDDVYYDQNIVVFRQKLWIQKVQINQSIYKGTVQDLTKVMKTMSVVYQEQLDRVVKLGEDFIAQPEQDEAIGQAQAAAYEVLQHMNWGQRQPEHRQLIDLIMHCRDDGRDRPYFEPRMEAEMTSRIGCLSDKFEQLTNHFNPISDTRSFIARCAADANAQRELKLDYILMDVGYYLQPETKEEREKMFWDNKARFHVQGREFTTVPGDYWLGWSEGTFRVTCQQQVIMTARGNGGSYTHGNKQLANLNGATLIDFGWWDDYVINLSYNNYLYTSAPVLDMPTPRISVQARWMARCMAVDSANPKLKTELDVWNKRAGKKEDFDHLQKAYEKHFYDKWEEGKAVEMMKKAGRNRMFQGMADDKQVKLTRGTFLVDSVRFTDELQDRSRNERGPNREWYQLRHRTTYVAMPPDLRIMCGPTKEEQEKRTKQGRSKMTMMQHQKLATQDAPMTSLDLMQQASAVQPWRTEYSAKQVIQQVTKEEKKKRNVERRTNMKLPENMYSRPATEYYREKELHPETFAINPLLVLPDWRRHNAGQLHSVRTYSEKYLKKPQQEYQGDIVSPEEVMKDQKVTLAGSIAMVEGGEIGEFEWNAKSINNRISGLVQRQFGAFQQYDAEHVARWQVFYRPEMRRRAKMFLERYDFEQDLTKYVDSKVGIWSESKCQLYRNNIYNAFKDERYTDYTGSFICMTKSGEVNHVAGELKTNIGGYTTGQSSRPRCIMCPTEEGFGIIQAIQSTLWAILKEVFPEFIHSYSKEELKDKIKNAVQSNWKSVSIDGSSWDSSQFAQLQQLETYFLQQISPAIKKLIEYNKDLISPDEGPSAGTIHTNVMNAFAQTLNHIFMRVPKINSPAWPEHVHKKFRRARQPFEDTPEQDWVHFAIDGTTFSGLSFRTTLGNTLRAIFYAYYYMTYTQVPSLTHEPWNSKQVYVIASGDDVVMWTEPQIANRVRQCILDMTTRDRNEQQVGLGQCVKEVILGDSTTFDFCSLWTYSPTSNISDLILLPDYSKLFTQKQYYSKKNADIHRNPALYVASKLIQVRMMCASRTVEGMLHAQLKNLIEKTGRELTAAEIQKAYMVYRMDQKEYYSSDYQAENFVDWKLGLDVGDIYSIYENNTIQILAGPKSQNRHERTHVHRTQDHYVLTTTNIEKALNAIRAMDPKTLLVDNEKDPRLNITNAMTMLNMGTNQALIFHGPEVEQGQHEVYGLLETLNTNCCCWDNNLERLYPNNHDLQRLYYETTDREMKLGLQAYAKLMGIRSKKSIDNYSEYSNYELTKEAVEYALTDAMILKDAMRLKAEPDGQRSIVTIGMSNYRLPFSYQANIFKSDESYCSKFQVMKFSELEQRISRFIGRHVKIMDAGSSEILGQYDIRGSYCVPQAIYASLFMSTELSDKFRTMLMKKDPAERAKIMSSQTQIKITKLKDIAGRYNGVGLTSIRKSFQGNATKNIHIWTVERPDGMFFTEGKIRRTDVHIVVAHGHAYAVIPQEMSYRELRPPVDCVHQCWTRYATSNAKQVIEMSRYMDPRDGQIPFYCPARQTIVASRMYVLGMIPRPKSWRRIRYTWSKLIGAQVPRRRKGRSEDDIKNRTQNTQDIQHTMQKPITEQASKLKSAIDLFVSTKQPNEFVQLMPCVGQVDNVYGVVFITQDEAAYLRQNLAELARKGLIVSIAGDLYRDLAMSDRQSARRSIKQFTAHNEKLGFDFDVGLRKHRAELSKQFSTSAYPSFLEEAKVFYQGFNEQLSAYFDQASQQFKITPDERAKLMKSQGRATELPIDTSVYERKIAGLEATLEEMTARENRLREETYVALDHQEVLERQIRGYEGKALVDPQRMMHFPATLRKNMKKMFDQLTDGEETKYVKSLVDPFHPECAGARVPTLLPRDTATFNTFSQIDVGRPPAATSHLIIGSLEQSTKTQFVQMTLPDSAFTATPEPFEAPVGNGAVALPVEGVQKYDFHAVRIGTLGDLNIQIVTDETASSVFTKHRTVSTGLRFFKTSSSDSESGQLDLHYSRDGATIDSNSDLKSLFSRPTNSSARMYLAGSYGPIRGQTGFVAQCSYRPHDQKSFEFHDPTNDQKSALYGDQLTPVWFYTQLQLVDPVTLKQMLVNPDYPLAPVYLVTDSLQQRHTFLARLSNMSENMQISVEYSQHLEGIPESTHYGFIQKSHALLTQATSPLELIQKMPTQQIFSNYAMKREDILQMIYSDAIRGLWGDTLFPMLKHLVSYGADSLSGDTVNNMIEAALDATMVTLSAAAPELAPAIVGLKEVIDEPLQSAAQDALKAAKRWAVGQQYPAIQQLTEGSGRQSSSRSTTTLSANLESFAQDSYH